MWSRGFERTLYSLDAAHGSADFCRGRLNNPLSLRSRSNVHFLLRGPVFKASKCVVVAFEQTSKWLVLPICAAIRHKRAEGREERTLSGVTSYFPGYWSASLTANGAAESLQTRGANWCSKCAAPVSSSIFGSKLHPHQIARELLIAHRQSQVNAVRGISSASSFGQVKTCA